MKLTVFSQRLQQVREANSLKQNELARLVGVTSATISAYEKEGKNPSFETVYNIAKVLGVSLDWLSGLDEELPNKEPQARDLLKSLMMILLYLDVGIDLDGNNTAIIIDNKQVQQYIKDCLQVKSMLKNSDLPEYAKDTLKQTLLERYKDSLKK